MPLNDRRQLGENFVKYLRFDAQQEKVRPSSRLVIVGADRHTELFGEHVLTRPLGITDDDAIRSWSARFAIVLTVTTRTMLPPPINAIRVAVNMARLYGWLRSRSNLQPPERVV